MSAASAKARRQDAWWTTVAKAIGATIAPAARKVCCNPIEVSYTVQDDAPASFKAKVLE